MKDDPTGHHVCHACGRRWECGGDPCEKDQAWVLGQVLAAEWARTYSIHQGSLKNAWEILALAAIRHVRGSARQPEGARMNADALRGARHG